MLDLNNFLSYHDVVELVDVLTQDIDTSGFLLRCGEIPEVHRFNVLHSLVGKVKRIKTAMEGKHRGC